MGESHWFGFARPALHEYVLFDLYFVYHTPSLVLLLRMSGVQRIYVLFDLSLFLVFLQRITCLHSKIASI